MSGLLQVSEEVRDALSARRPLVALESAVISHGLPADAALDAVQRQLQGAGASGALAAIVGILDGTLKVGLSLDECARLARPGHAKASLWNLGSIIASRASAGTTVAATIRAAVLAGISVVSTGGIGGVHPGGEDVSADLEELACQKVCVVCSGPKNILDVRLTLERLETLGIPVLGWRSQKLAGFLAHTTELPVSGCVESLSQLYATLRAHWSLKGAGIIVSNPLGAELAIPAQELDRTEAVEEAVAGGGLTPYLLERLRDRLGERVVRANIALLEANARLAGEIAAGL